MSTPIIGCDLGMGGGPQIRLLPCDPIEMLCIGFKEAYTPGEGYRATLFELWGLDPRLVVAVNFARVPSVNRTTDFPTGNITATIEARTLSRTANGATVVGPVMPATDLFLNGGVLDTGSFDDGCELCTAVQGVRFLVTAIRTDATSVDIVASAVCRPNVALGCEDLALALFGGLTLSRPIPQFW